MTYERAPGQDDKWTVSHAETQSAIDYGVYLYESGLRHLGDSDQQLVNREGVVVRRGNPVWVRYQAEKYGMAILKVIPRVTHGPDRSRL